jgi:hypothetical protein
MAMIHIFWGWRTTSAMTIAALTTPESANAIDNA